MKHLSAITFLIILLAASDSFAGMGHGMMRETQGGTMHEHMVDYEGSMGHEQMMGNMIVMMKDISRLMGDMSEMMK